MGRLAPLSGVLGVLMVVLSFAVLGGNTPGSEDSGAVVNSFYDAHQGREFAASLVLAAAAPFLVIFAVSLALALWPQEGTRSALWQLTLIAGGAVAGAAFAISGMLQFAVTDAADQSGTGEATLQALNVLTADSWVAFNPALGVLMLGGRRIVAVAEGDADSGLDRSHRRHRALHPVRRLRRADRDGAVDHHHERAALRRSAGLAPAVA